MSVIAVLKYVGTALPTGSTTETLFTSSSPLGMGAYSIQGAGLNSYVLKLRNSHRGTLLFERSSDGSSWTTVYQQALAPSPTNGINRREFCVDGIPHFRVRWTNGGTTQTTFDVMQSLCHAPPASQAQESAAVVRGPFADADNNWSADVGITHANYNIPAAWLGRRVTVQTVGSGVNGFILFGDASGAVEADRAAVVTGTGTFTGNAKIPWCVPGGGERDVFVDPSWTHFSVEADTAATKMTIMLSDY
jgi:hypothetical protein